jgi:hypothetical protein
MLTSMAGVRAALFAKEIKEDLNDGKTNLNSLSIPVERIRRTQIHHGCVTNNGKENVFTKLTDEIKRIFSTPRAETVVGGFANLLNDALMRVVGVSEGIDEVFTDTMTTIDGIAVVRVDLALWCRKIKTMSLRTRVEMALSYVAVKSTVDMQRFSFNSFADAYNPLIEAELESLPFAEREKAREKYMSKALKMYNKCRNAHGSALQGAAQEPVAAAAYAPRAKGLDLSGRVDVSALLPEGEAITIEGGRPPVITPDMLPKRAFVTDAAPIPAPVPDAELDFGSVDLSSIDLDALPKKSMLAYIGPPKQPEMSEDY